MPTLNWIGKDTVVNHHKEVPFHLLRCDPKRSVDSPLLSGEGQGVGSDNLLVQGDNLLALKALLPHYAGQVKCIYIDPPYNTGNEGWVYNDNVNSPEMKTWLGKVVGSETEDLSRHDKWLCMMYPRLVLLREMLREDGAIFISIDDVEVANLRSLIDEIFGRQNFLANVIWQKKYTRANDAAYFSDNHDHILVYAKKKELFEIGRVSRTEIQNKAYKNPDEHPLGNWKPTPLHAKSGNNTSEYIFSNGVKWHPPKGTYRRYSDETMARLDENNEIWFGKDGNSIPQRKTFLGSLAEGVTPVTLWTHEIAGDNHIARDEVKKLLTDTEFLFDSPKPTTLLSLVLQLATNPGDLILDSFAGSGTTGHAVLQMNKEDGGNRRFILVEMDENICQNITAERLKRVSLGYEWKDGKGNKKQEEGLGGGFRFCTLGEPLFNAEGQIQKEVTYEDLARHVYFTETGQPLPERLPKSQRLRKSEYPLLGVQNGVAVYLLYNGVMKDKSRDGGNVLTRALLAELPEHDGAKVIYGNGSLLSENTLRGLGITFKQVPYEIKVS